MISKELLSEVLGSEVKSYQTKEDNYSIKKNELGIIYASSGIIPVFGVINIHELAHKCKEWAFHRGVSIYCIQYKIDKGEYCVYIYDIHEETEILDTGVDDMTFATEPEAIFKACEWIKDNK